MVGEWGCPLAVLCLAHLLFLCLSSVSHLSLLCRTSVSLFVVRGLSLGSWFVVTKDKPYTCPSCKQVFALKKVHGEEYKF